MAISHTIYIATDAKSQSIRGWIRSYLEIHKHTYSDLGAQSEDDPIDITKFVPEVADGVIRGKTSAIVACGNGVGVSIGMNRYRGIRAALAMTPEFAEWGRVYDDCNVLCLPAWSLYEETMVSDILDAWFAAVFDPIPRRIERVKRLDKLGP